MNLKKGAEGERVKALQQALKDKGFDPGDIDGKFGPGTEAAVMAFQSSEGLLKDGIAGPNTLKALGLDVIDDDKRPIAVDQFTIAVVSEMFPSTPIGNIKANLPLVLSALQALGLGDRDMILMTLATIRAETEGFEPISEFQSRFNTPPKGPPFALYDNRKELGNKGRPDGPNFKGRGFVQLTGRFNYTKFGPKVGVDLVSNPDKANDPKIAADILACFLKDAERCVRNALLDSDLRKARICVNGGTHGLDRFKDAFNTGLRLSK